MSPPPDDDIFALCSTPGGERAEITAETRSSSIVRLSCSTPGGERAEITEGDCERHSGDGAVLNARRRES